MNEIVKTQANLPANQEAANIASEAMHDAGFQRMIKFRHGDYWCEDSQIHLGTQFLAHCIGWTKCWIHFEHRQVVERKVYRVAQGERPPERDQLDCNDPNTWPPGIDGKPADPWVYQYLLPLESKDGEVRIFVASSFGGRRAVADLCAAWGRRASRGQPGQPIIKLQKALMPTKSYGDVPRPLFEIIEWDDGVREAVRELDTKTINRANDMNDEIPF